jgi:single-strand DNA-binding protein
LGRDPELRYTPDGTPVVSFSVADNGRSDVIWFEVTAWRRLAETCNEYLEKGRYVAVAAHLKAGEGGRPRVWTGKDGKPRASFEVVAHSVEFLGGGEAPGASKSKSEDDEIPF